MQQIAAPKMRHGGVTSPATSCTRRLAHDHAVKSEGDAYCVGMDATTPCYNTRESAGVGLVRIEGAL